jgi:hypothetical protein
MSDWFEETYNNDNLKLLRGKLDKAKAECDKAEAEMPEDLDSMDVACSFLPAVFLRVGEAE